MDTVERPFRRTDLTDLLEFVGGNAAARAAHVYLMRSDVCWRLPGSAPKDNVRLFEDAAGLAGWVWFEPPGGFECDLRADLGWDSPVAAAMLAWAEQRRAEFEPGFPWYVELESMTAWAEALANPVDDPPDDRGNDPRNGNRWLAGMVFDSDQGRIDALRNAGYEPSEHFAPDYRFDLSHPIEDPSLPEGFRIRSTTGDDLAERISVHRDAWLGSTYDADRHARIQASVDFDGDLDLVLETPGGEFACYCLCWTDPVSGIGSYEPVGARPSWRGKGLSRALILAGFRRLAERGMSHARVSTAGFNHPAQRLYEGCGFVRTGTLRTFLKRLD